VFSSDIFHLHTKKTRVGNQTQRSQKIARSFLVGGGSHGERWKNVHFVSLGTTLGGEGFGKEGRMAEKGCTR